MSLIWTMLMTAALAGGSEEAEERRLRLRVLGLPLSLSEPEAPPGTGPARAEKKKQQDYRDYKDELDRKRRGEETPDQFPAYAAAPYPMERKNAWHGLFGTPPLEEAATLFPNTYRARVMIGLAGADWSSTTGGGPGRFHAATLTETFEFDYNVSTVLQLGLRVRMGELGEADDETITVFDGGRQIVPDGERGFAVESITPRAKLIIPTDFVKLGLLFEAKIPVADAENLLTSGTVDLALCVLATKRWSDLALTVNLGVVVPAGSPDLFVTDVQANPYFTAGAEFAWRIAKPFVVLAQLEFNSSALRDVAALTDPAAAVMVGGRVQVSKGALLSAGAGFGLTEASGGLLVSAGMDFLF